MNKHSPWQPTRYTYSWPRRAVALVPLVYTVAITPTVPVWLQFFLPEKIRWPGHALGGRNALLSVWAQRVARPLQSPPARRRMASEASPRLQADRLGRCPRLRRRGIGRPHGRRRSLSGCPRTVRTAEVHLETAVQVACGVGLGGALTTIGSPRPATRSPSRACATSFLGCATRG